MGRPGEPDRLQPRNKGWITINNGPEAQTRTFSTGLPAGTYCNLIKGVPSGGSCAGIPVTVDGHGQARVTVPALGAVAITA